MIMKELVQMGVGARRRERPDFTLLPRQGGSEPSEGSSSLFVSTSRAPSNAWSEAV